MPSYAPETWWLASGLRRSGLYLENLESAPRGTVLAEGVPSRGHPSAAVLRAEVLLSQRVESGGQDVWLCLPPTSEQGLESSRE